MAKRKGLLGRKVAMTQLFTEGGEAVPVTVLEAGPCHVVQIKTTAVDGYNALQLGFGHAKEVNKPLRGHLGECPPLRYLREIRTDDVDQYQVGQVISVEQFQPGDLVDVIATSKGRGFAGAMKRHGFSGGPITHGQSDRQRAVGSIGSGTTPGRTLRGLRGPGHMGNARVTTLNLEVVRVDPENNVLALKGSVPGARNGLVVIRSAAKTKEAKKKHR
jgi:large subunit ribosomal protein L3